MTANVCMGAMVVLECGQKRLRLAHFHDDPGELDGHDCPWPAPVPRREGNFIFQFRRMALLRTDSNGVRNMAC